MSLCMVHLCRLMLLHQRVFLDFFYVFFMFLFISNVLLNILNVLIQSRDQLSYASKLNHKIIREKNHSIWKDYMKSVKDFVRKFPQKTIFLSLKNAKIQSYKNGFHSKKMTNPYTKTETFKTTGILSQLFLLRNSQSVKSLLLPNQASHETFSVIKWKNA